MGVTMEDSNKNNKSKQDLALFLKNLGWNVVPLCTPIDSSHCTQHTNCSDPGKVSLINLEDYKNMKPTIENVSDWWKKYPDANIGIVTEKIINIKESQKLVDSITKWEKQSLSKEKIPAEWYSPVSQLMKNGAEPTSWLIKDIWLDNAIGLIASEPNSFKTYLGLDMAICIASGKKFLNYYDVPKKKNVLYVLEEGTENNLKTRIKQICAGYGIVYDELTNLYLSCQKKVSITDDKWQEEIERRCECDDISVLFFDPLVRMWNGDENKSGDVSKMLEFVRKLQCNSKNKRSIIIIHHNKKISPLGRKYASAGYMIRGSSDFHAFTDSLIGIYHNKTMNALDISIEHRGGDKPKPFHLKIEINENRFKFIRKDGRIGVIEREELEDKIYRHIKNKTPKEETYKRLKELFGITDKTKDKIIGNLKFRGVKEKKEKRKPNNRLMVVYYIS